MERVQRANLRREPNREPSLILPLLFGLKIFLEQRRDIPGPGKAQVDIVEIERMPIGVRLAVGVVAKELDGIDALNRATAGRYAVENHQRRAEVSLIIGLFYRQF